MNLGLLVVEEVINGYWECNVEMYGDNVLSENRVLEIIH